jgi:hypothetical protein
MLPSRLLDDQLVSIYKNSVTRSVMVGNLRSFVTENLKPIDSFEPRKQDLMRNGGANADNLPPVNFTTLQRLTTVIAQAAFGNGSTREGLFEDVVIRGHTTAGIMTIRQFMALTAGDQMAAIDQAWNKVCTKRAYNKLTSELSEPVSSVVAASGTPVPSGAIPGIGTAMRVAYLNDARIPNAFTGLGVGFRVDGSGADYQRSVDRITGFGMTTQLKNRYLMYTVKGWEVQGTTVDLDTNAPRVWSTKNDLFNESAVCVSRNFYGATAFPMREMTDTAVMWAVDVAGLRAFDTEAYQVLENRQWRPGEKAYKQIPVAKVMGYVLFNKLGAPAEGGWNFSIPNGATWTFLGDWAGVPAADTTSREARMCTYVNDQLAGWAGADRTITGAYDFA